jgi:RNA-directed DNA polymerase
MNERLNQEMVGKESNRTPTIGSPEKSDEVVVPKISANKGVLSSAEQEEERTSTERNSEKPIANRTLSRGFASQGLDRIRHRAEQDKFCVFDNLYQFLMVDLLRWSFYQLKRDSAPGLDGTTWWMYEKQLESRLPELECELHTGRYRATPEKRTYITKENGEQRPIGIQAVEDKVVQRACVTILNEVYEPRFCGLSYGFRPERSQHMALDALHEGICRRKINWIVDCDIKAFFDSIDHDLLMGMVEKRVGDKRLLRLIRKWLRLGWEEDGVRTSRTVGTAQGSVISPLLANIMLNEVMDQWFIQWRKETKGDCVMVRFADDAVMGFQFEREARAFLEALTKQLKTHKLTLHPAKTRLIEFGRYAASNRKQRGEKKPETFNFLGFTHCCGKTRAGKFRIVRTTIRKRQARKLKEIKFELIRRINENLSNIGKWLGSVMRGVTQYYAVPGNMDAVKEFYTQIGRHWLWVIRRRSHKARKRWTWERFYRLQDKYIPRPRVAHPYPSDRFDVTHSR